MTVPVWLDWLMSATIAAAGCVVVWWAALWLDADVLLRRGPREWFATMVRRYGPHGDA